MGKSSPWRAPDLCRIKTRGLPGLSPDPSLSYHVLGMSRAKELDETTVLFHLTLFVLITCKRSSSQTCFLAVQTHTWPQDRENLFWGRVPQHRAQHRCLSRVPIPIPALPRAHRALIVRALEPSLPAGLSLPPRYPLFFQINPPAQPGAVRPERWQPGVQPTSPSTCPNVMEKRPISGY